MFALIEIFNIASNETIYSGVCGKHPQNIFVQSLFNFNLYSYMGIKLDMADTPEFGLRISTIESIDDSIMDNLYYEEFSYMIMAHNDIFSLIEVKRPVNESDYTLMPEEADRIITNARKVLTQLNELGDENSFFEKYVKFFNHGIPKENSMKSEFLLKQVLVSDTRKSYSGIIEIQK